MKTIRIAKNRSLYSDFGWGLIGIFAVFAVAMPGCSTKEKRANTAEFDSLKVVVTKTSEARPTAPWPVFRKPSDTTKNTATRPI